MSDEENVKNKSIGKTIGVAVLCLLIIAWCCRVMTYITFPMSDDPPSTGGILSWIAAIGIAIYYYRNDDEEVGVAEMCYLATWVGIGIGILAILASVLLNWDAFLEYARWVSGYESRAGLSDLEKLWCSFANSWASYFANANVIFGAVFACIWLLILGALAFAVPGGISYLVMKHKTSPWIN